MLGGPIKSELSLNRFENQSIQQDFKMKNMSVKEAPDFYKLVLNMLCVTLSVTSSITLLQAVLWENLSIYDQIVIKNSKNR